MTDCDEKLEALARRMVEERKKEREQEEKERGQKDRAYRRTRRRERMAMLEEDTASKEIRPRDATHRMFRVAELAAE